MQLPDDITETSTISEITTSISGSSSNSSISSNSSSVESNTSSSESSKEDSMAESDSDDSMSIDSSDSEQDSSSDYHPSESESSEASTIMDTSEEELSEEEQQITKKRKRNPLDSFCLYTIRPKCPNDTNLYIGSTTCFNRRKAQHKKAVTNKRGGTYYCILYRYIRKCGGWDNFIMEKVLDYPCETKHEGLLKEKEYIIKHESTLNSVMPVSDFTERMNDTTI
jgi:predicted GIY-YIG superfamily endonuclease